MAAPSSALRAIDANLNRASEALRTLEDIARFTLNSASLSSKLKAIRHDLGSLAESIDPVARASARDTPGDVGTSISTQREGERASIAAVATAAARRLTEALRSIEEHAKLLPDGASHARRAEAIRYAAYDTEKLTLLATRPHSARQWRLCVLITESLCTRPWHDVAAAALRGGADCVQLREKSLDGADLIDRTQVLLTLAEPHGASVVVNDRLDVALAAGAHGVHLGQADLPPDRARAIAGGQLLIGVSCTTTAQAHAAFAGGADGIGIGPMFATATKANPGGRTDGSLAGPPLLEAILADPALAPVPHLAIGGIDTARAHDLATLGCRGIAVSSVVCASEDPETATRSLAEAIAPTTLAP